MINLTVRERETLDFIINYKNKHGYSPSINDIKKGIYTASNTNVLRFIRQLEDKNYISTVPHTARSITIL